MVIRFKSKIGKNIQEHVMFVIVNDYQTILKSRFQLSVTEITEFAMLVFLTKTGTGSRPVCA